MQKSRDHCPRERARRCEKCVFTCVDARTQGCVSVCRTAAQRRQGPGRHDQRDPRAHAYENRIHLSGAPLLWARILSSFSLFRFLFARSMNLRSFVRAAPELTLGEPFCFALLSHAKNACDANETRKEKFSLRLFFALYQQQAKASYSLFAPVNSLISRKYGFELLDWFLRWHTLLYVYISLHSSRESQCEEMRQVYNYKDGSLQRDLYAE